MFNPSNEAEVVTDSSRPKSKSCFDQLTSAYANWLVAYPILNGILVVIFLVTTGTLALYSSEFPVFDDPVRDFVSIGTPMSGRLYQLRSLQHHTLPVPTTTKLGTSRGVRSVPEMRPESNSLEFCFDLPDQRSEELWSRFAALSKMVVCLDAVALHNSSSASALGSFEAVEALCSLQLRIEALPGYRELCSKPNLLGSSSRCCPIWSLPNFIASVVNASSCHQLTRADVAGVGRLTAACQGAFERGELRRACWDVESPSRWLCPTVPPVCFAHRHLLLLLATIATDRCHLLVLPVWRRVGLQFWRTAELHSPDTLAQLTHNLSVAMAIEALEVAGEYGELAVDYVWRDTAWVALGAALLVVLLLLLTRFGDGGFYGGLVVVLATFVALFWSLAVAFGVYQRGAALVGQQRPSSDVATAFPLLNMMTLVLLLGLGADDILVFQQVWLSSAQTEGGGDKARKVARMTATLHHAVPSVCLTSVATLGGLLTALSSVTVAVKRFAVYASLAVACHLVYVLTAMPILLLFVRQPSRSPRQCLCTSGRNPMLFLRFICPPLLLSIGGVSAYLLFVAGWLEFPSGSLQPALYRSSNPVEVYRLRGGKFSWAEATLRRHRGLISLHAVWGVEPVDPRNPWTWNPKDEDVLNPPTLEKSFRIDSSESVGWLRRFCSQLMDMPWVYKPPPVLPRSSYLEEDALSLSTSQNSGCLFGRGLFSFDDFVESHPELCSSNLTQCLSAFAESSRSPTGLRFSPESGEIIGLVVSVTTTLSVTNTTFVELRDFGAHTTAWFEGLQESAPAGLSGGYLVSPELAVFETYEDVLRFLPLSLSLSVLLAGLLVLLSTRSGPLCILAVLVVTSALLLSGVLLVALGDWRLGVVEALVLSLAGGLAVDPCLHLACAVMRSGGAGWVERAQDALGRVGTAVAGAALSTAVAGAAVLPSELQCYRQMGLFLVVLMTSALLLCGFVFAGCVACLPNRCCPTRVRQ